MPAVSIITPVYNAVKTLLNTAETVLNQTSSDWEWILVDDGSNDGTYSLCCEFASLDSRITALKIPPEGVSAARNTGLDAAKGQYIMFLDADDLLAPEAVEQALALQKKYPDHWILWRYKMSVGNEAFWGSELDKTGETLHTAADLGNLYGKCFIAMPWNKLYRADIAKSLRFDRQYSLGEDLLFCLDYLKAVTAQGKDGICVAHQSLIEYVVGGTNTLSTKYLPQYLPLWEHHFQRLNDECVGYGASAKDMESLHRQELAVMSRGIVDILRRDPAPQRERKAKAKAALSSPWLQALCREMKKENAYSAFYLSVRWKNLSLLEKMVRWQAEGNPLFGKFDWAGYYLLGGRRSRE